MTSRTSNFLLLLLIIQNTIVVLVARLVSSNYNYDVKQLLLIAELIKLTLALLIESYSASRKGGEGSLCKSLYQHVWLKPLDSLKLSIPALLYVFQNVFNFIAISMIPVPLFLIIQQTKLVKTTFLSIILLNRTYNLVQWISVISLCLGSGLCFFSIMNDDSEREVVEEMEEDINQVRSLFLNYEFGKKLIGIMLVVAANFSSSLAGVYFELVIKGVDKRPDDIEGDEQDTIEMKKFLSDNNIEDEEESTHHNDAEVVEKNTFERESLISDEINEDIHVINSNNTSPKKLQTLSITNNYGHADNECEERDECEDPIENNTLNGEEIRTKNSSDKESFDEEKGELKEIKLIELN